LPPPHPAPAVTALISFSSGYDPLGPARHRQLALMAALRQPPAARRSPDLLPPAFHLGCN
jgi:hypothetical protein